MPSERITKKRSMILCNSPGSTCSVRSVEPFTSAEEHGHLLALAFEGASRREDLLGEVSWGVGARIRGWAKRTRANGLATVQAELGSSRQLRTAGSATMPELCAALE